MMTKKKEPEGGARSFAPSRHWYYIHKCIVRRLLFPGNLHLTTGVQPPLPLQWFMGEWSSSSGSRKTYVYQRLFSPLGLTDSKSTGHVSFLDKDVFPLAPRSIHIVIRWSQRSRLMGSEPTAAPSEPRKAQGWPLPREYEKCMPYVWGSPGLVTIDNIVSRK